MEKDTEQYTLLETWRGIAYNAQTSENESKKFWANYFTIEQGIYKKLLADSNKVVKGTVKELAEEYGTDLLIMVGFLDGINESLTKANPIETMTEDTEVEISMDLPLLYKNMVEADAEWLYTLEEWDSILSEEERKELYKEQKRSHTVVKEKKVGRNDPCPCGSGKKYKFCCGK